MNNNFSDATHMLCLKHGKGFYSSFIFPVIFFKFSGDRWLIYEPDWNDGLGEWQRAERHFHHGHFEKEIIKKLIPVPQIIKDWE